MPTKQITAAKKHQKTSSDCLVGVAHAAGEDCADDHLDVLDEGVMMEVVEIDADLVGEDDFVVVALGVRLLGEEIFLITVLQGCRPGDAGTESQDFSVLTFELVGIARYVRARTDKAHVADEDIPEFRQLVEFVMAELCAEGRDAAFASDGDRTSAVAYGHGAELVHGEELPVAPDTFLLEDDRAARHLDADEDSHHQQYRPKKQQTDESHQPVEDEFEGHTQMVKLLSLLRPCICPLY